MRKLTRSLLWLFVFTIPWDVVALPGIGTIARVFGALALGTAVLTTQTEGRLRKPGAIFWAALAFTAWSALTLLWTISSEATLERTLTYAQLLGSVWIVQEFVRTREQHQSLLMALCLGAFVPIADLLNNFRTGVEISMAGRYSASGVNANELGMTLVIGIPIAWHLFQRGRGIIRVIALIYFALAPVGILLTGTRTAFLAGIVALSIIPLTLPRLSLRSVLLIVVSLIAVAATTAVVVPQRSWTRMFTIGNELRGGNMTGRVDIWRAGASLIPEHPLVGVGAGAFGPAVEPLLAKAQAPHNLVIGVLVEEGLVGLALLATVLVACVWAVVGLPAPDRQLWGVLMASWLVGVMSTNWEYGKISWLLFGLLAARYELEGDRIRHDARRGNVGVAAAPPLLAGRATSHAIPVGHRTSSHWDRRAIARGAHE